MTAKAIPDDLRPLPRESYKKVMLNHGVPEPFFGVKIEDLKKMTRRAAWRRQTRAARSSNPRCKGC